MRVAAGFNPRISSLNSWRDAIHATPCPCAALAGFNPRISSLNSWRDAIHATPCPCAALAG